MDESLKARLIGAAVLVVVAVLLIPELLSGRKATEAVSGEASVPRGTRTGRRGRWVERRSRG
jgi:cell division septation protein DedD